MIIHRYCMSGSINLFIMRMYYFSFTYFLNIYRRFPFVIFILHVFKPNNTYRFCPNNTYSSFHAIRYQMKHINKQYIEVKKIFYDFD